MRRHVRRSTFTALLLAAAATASLTGCQSGPSDTGGTDGTGATAPAGSAASGKPDGSASASRPASGGAEAAAAPSASASASEGPFAGLSATEISDRALEATTGARSLRMTGDVPDEESGGTIRIDLALDREGECAGTMSMDGQGEAELIKTGDTVYLKYDEQFLRAQSEGEPQADTEALVSLLAGRWTKMSATGPDAKDMTSFCDLDTMLDGADGSGEGDGSDGDGDAQVTRGRATTVDGAPAFTLLETDGQDRSTLYIAAEGKPYLLRFDHASGSAGESGTLLFSDYDEPVPTDAPTGDVLDLDAMNQRTA
ncbi:hypothetical protein ACFW5U_29370 [Streptomyces rochei]|uniref:hypothetical protein n=1 Tax=Streptomyces TaxID=1883 RepID=UPI0004C57648|nr:MULTISPECIES: hypothetical protein [unclassified Streptomyces]RSS09264.1 hypothetical protein EF915_32795 [Streptomyces sp. WAC08401]